MPASQANLGYGCQLGRQAANLTTIAAAITASGSPQAVTPAVMTSIAVGTVLWIDTGNAALMEPVMVSGATGSTFTAIFQNNHGTNIEIALSVPLLEIVKIGGPGMKADMKECTNMASPNGYKEFLAGLREGGDCTFEANFIPKESTLSQQNLRTDFETGYLPQMSLALPVAGTGIWSFKGYVSGLTPAYPLDDRITVTGTLKITGKPVLF